MTRLTLSPRALGGALVASLLTAAVCGIGTIALGQDQSAATANDVIFARKVLMGAIGNNMDEIDGMLETGNIDIPHASEHADTISIMMMAFPHMFPPASNEWKPNVQRDPGTDTFAAPEVWTRFTEFYQQAQAAAKAAYAVSRAQTPDEFKKFGTELRQACDACHATFMKPE
jgi:cytochrome c556